MALESSVNMAKSAASSTLIDDLVKKLELAIFRGEFPPGTRIREARLADELSVGRSALREAVRQLEGRKLVVRHPNLGTSVTKLTDADMLDLLEIRESLEITAIRKACDRITEAELRSLRQSMERHEVARVDRLQNLYGEWHNYDFHSQIALASGNRRLFDLLCGDIWFLMRTYRYPKGLSPNTMIQGAASHKTIMEALEARDADACERQMREHLATVRTHLSEHLKLGQSSQAATTPKRKQKGSAAPNDTQAD